MTAHSCMSDKNFRTDSRYGGLRLTKRTLFCISHTHTEKPVYVGKKTVAQKLQVREGQKLLLVNPPQDYFELLAKQLPENVVMVKETGEADVIQVFTSSNSQLNEQLGKVRQLLRPKGILWVTYPKEPQRSRPTSTGTLFAKKRRNSAWKQWPYFRSTTTGPL